MSKDEKAQNEMDDAAAIAKEELSTIDIDTIRPVANWIKKYYGTAGYKRLCRILLEVIK